MGILERGHLTLSFATTRNPVVTDRMSAGPPTKDISGHTIDYTHKLLSSVS